MKKNGTVVVDNLTGEINSPEFEILDRLPIMVYLISLDGKIININQRAVKILRYDNKDDLIGKDIVETIYHPQYRRKARALFKKWKRKGELRNEEMKIITRDLYEIDVLLNVDTVHDTEGNPISTVSTHIDITDLKEAQRMLNDRNELTRSMIEYSPDWISILDLNGNIVFMNKNSQKLLELKDPSSFINRSWTELWEEDKKEAQRSFDEANEGRTRSFEGFHPTSRSSPRWWNVKVSPIFDENGVVKNIIVVSRDITEHKLSKKKVHDQETYYRSLLYSIHEDIIVIDKNYMITDINNTALKTVGKERKDVIGKHCFEVTHGLSSPCIELGEHCGFLDVLKTGKSCNYHHEHINSDGSIRQIDILMSPIFDENDDVVKVIEAARDVTDIYDATRSLNIAGLKYSTLLENTLNPVFEMDGAGRILEFNEACMEFFEFFDKRSPSADLIELSKEIMTSLDIKDEEQENIGTIEKDLMINGKSKSIMVNIIRFEVEGENTIYGIGQDISDLKNKELQIRSAKTALDQVLDFSPVPLWVSDRNGTVIRTNNALLRTMDVSSGKVIERYNVFEDRNLVRENVMSKVKDVFKNHKPTRFEILWKANEGGMDYRGKDIFIDVSMFPVLEINGELKNVICQWVDITKLKHVEKELKRRESLFRSLLNSIPAPVFYKNRSGEFMGVNQAFEKFFGMSEKEVQKKTVFDMNPPHLAKYYQAKDEDLIRNGGKLSYESRIENASNEYRDVVIHKAVLKDNGGNVNGFIGVIFDITEQKKTENELKQQKEIADLNLDLLSHDLGNIHQGLEGSLELMGMCIDDKEKLEELLKVAKSSVYNSITLTKEIMLLSMIDTDKPDLMDVDLERIIRDSFDIIKGMFPDKDIELDLETNVNSMRAEPLIREIFTNLMHNSVRFQSDNPWVKIKTFTDRSRIVIMVSDKGPGIPEDMKKDLFKKFGKKGKTTRTGLGLTIVNALVERYNGTITISDRVEGDHSKGVMFVMRFPLNEGGENSS